MDRLKSGYELTTPLILQIPTSSTSYNGVHQPSSYTDSTDILFANFKTFGGTETVVNGVFEIIETAEIVCWYRPDLKSNCRIKRAEDGAVFEILGDVEDISLRHQQMKFKVKRVKGGV